LTWNELNTHDAASTKAFYAEVIGWEVAEGRSGDLSSHTWWLRSPECGAIGPRTPAYVSALKNEDGKANGLSCKVSVLTDLKGASVDLIAHLAES
jgi:hypothetical protein